MFVNIHYGINIHYKENIVDIYKILKNNIMKYAHVNKIKKTAY